MTSPIRFQSRVETAGFHSPLEGMEAAEQTVEGVPAAGLALTLVQQREGLLDRLPLLQAVTAIIGGAADPAGLATSAALPPRV